MCLVDSEQASVAQAKAAITCNNILAEVIVEVFDKQAKMVTRTFETYKTIWQPKCCYVQHCKSMFRLHIIC